MCHIRCRGQCRDMPYFLRFWVKTSPSIDCISIPPPPSNRFMSTAPQLMYRPTLYRSMVIALEPGGESPILSVNTSLSSFPPNTVLYINRAECGCELGRCPNFNPDAYGSLCSKVREQLRAIALLSLPSI
jgi:hypothetical protein